MSRGIGKTQRAILDALAGEQRGALPAVELAKRLGISKQRTRVAIRALEARESVVVSTEHVGWKTLVDPSSRKGRIAFIDPAAVEETPGAWRFDHDGEEFGAVLQMPVSGLVVWLPMARAGYLAGLLERKMAETAKLRHRTAPIAELADFERLTGRNFLDVISGA